ncbi:Ig-like domain-containing protein, partial [Xanthocytophaga flava]|uniref:Ig-like domain-containing protein n=1 Tax=Xanthocytophaga flava TaxID=3048013 RepID=UPI0028D1D96A
MKKYLLPILILLLSYIPSLAQKPVVSTYSPANGATNVQTSQNLVLTFNTTMKKGSSGKVILYNGSTKVDSVDVLSSAVTISGSQVTINPANDLPKGQTIAIQITPGTFLSTVDSVYTGITDTNTWKFTTDGTNPAAVTFTPANNSVNAAVDANLRIVFSEKIRKGTGTITIGRQILLLNQTLETINVATAPDSVVSIVNDSILVINPVNNFPSLAQITVGIPASAIQDLSGNSYSGLSGLQWTFLIVDINPPGRLTYTPKNGATNVLASSNLILSFDEKVKKGTGNIVIRNGATTVETINVASAPSTVLSITDSIVTINPVNNLPAAGNITVTIASGAFSDLAGNNYGGNLLDSWSFTIDNTVPALITSSLSPANSATNVSSNANLVFRLSEKVQKGTGNIVIKNGATTVETIAVTASNVTIANDSIITINPATDFPSSGNISITLEAGTFEDLSGNKFAGISTWAFQVADIVAPTLIASSLSPANNATNVAANSNLVFRLSKKIQKGTGNIVIRNGSTVVETIAVTASNVTITNDSIVTINPTSDFPSSGSISVSIGANTFEDLSGNKFAGFSSWSFQAADIIAPTLVANSYSPANGATNVAADANLVFRLSEKVQKGTGNIVIKQGSTVLETIAVTSALVTISNDSIVTINPVNNFPSSGSVSVEIAANTFEDVSGNKFAGNTTAIWTFQSALVDATIPVIIAGSYYPAQNATGIPVDTILRFRFSEKVKKGAGKITILNGSTVYETINV